MADDKQARPGQSSETRKEQAGCRATGSTTAYDRRAALVLRVAWLRVTGHQMFAVDPSGQLSAQLWDLADLLEVLDAEGRWAL